MGFPLHKLAATDALEQGNPFIARATFLLLAALLADIAHRIVRKIEVK